MPNQVDGTWYSDDGTLYWDGAVWRPTVPAPPGAAQAAAAGPAGACQVCWATPAAKVTFAQHIGVVIVWVNRRVKGVFCRDCAIALFRREMNLTLATGWWGVISFFLGNPITIIYDLVQRARVARWKPPQRPEGAPPPLPLGRPVFLRPGIAVPIGLFALLLALNLSPRG
jgi:hypothetical protein